MVSQTSIMQHFLLSGLLSALLVGCSNDASVPDTAQVADQPELVSETVNPVLADTEAEPEIIEPAEQSVQTIVAVEEPSVDAAPAPAEVAQPVSTPQPVRVDPAPQVDEPPQAADAFAQTVALAQAGNAEAQYQVAASLNGDAVESSKWYLAAAEQGHVDAQVEMAVRYMNGLGVEQNAEEAERWLALAESQLQPQGSGPDVVVVKQRYVRFAPRPDSLSLAGRNVVNPSVYPPILEGNQPQDLSNIDPGAPAMLRSELPPGLAIVTPQPMSQLPAIPAAVPSTVPSTVPPSGFSRDRMTAPVSTSPSLRLQNLRINTPR